MVTVDRAVIHSVVGVIQWVNVLHPHCDSRRCISVSSVSESG